jgi:FkbM family methyltransferase
MTETEKIRLQLPHGFSHPGWCDLLYRPGTLDEAVIREVWVEDVYHLRGLDVPEDGAILDVGAHIGTFAAQILTWRDDLTIVCVEPDPANLELLYRNLAPWAGGGRVVILDGAVVGDPDGEQPFLLGENATAHLAADADGSRPVRRPTLYPLADLIPSEGIALAKIDCEGSEYEILAGTHTGRLGRCHRIHLEWHGYGPAAHPWIEPGSFGRLCEKLAETHTFQTFGRPADGGMLYGTAL